jgi:predicted metalloenzyme YecM
VPDAANAIDHVCWRCETAEEYHDAVKALADAGHDVAGTKSIGGRPITTVRLKAPVRWARFQIPAIEVPAPKAFRPRPRGFEHAEVALLCDADGFTETNAIEALLSKFPDLEWNRDGVRKAINPDVSLSLGGGVAVKFHNRPLLDVVDFERASGASSSHWSPYDSVRAVHADP